MQSRSMNVRPCSARTSQMATAQRPVASRRAVISQANPAPKTGHHSVEDALAQEALAKFFDGDLSTKRTPTKGGVNNVVQYVETGEGEKYILRIYNNGNKSDKVKFEHEVLAQLTPQTLSFDVPRVLPSKNGRPYEQLSNGAECCVFHIIPGTLAKTTSPEEVGRATGELCRAMSSVKVDMVPPIAPFWDLFRQHHAVGTREVFYNEVATNPGFAVCQDSIDYLIDEIKKLEAKLNDYRQMGLPEQMIHADLHYDNVMVVGDSVSGLLDFEFCTFDWRAMEVAVALSKYVGEDNPLSLCERFCEGFFQNCELTEDEIEGMPDMINLRIFSNVVYFTGRAIAKEDGLDSLTSRAPAYTKRVKWVNANREAIKAAIRAKMMATAKVPA